MTFILVCLLVVLILVSGFLSASETALFSLSSMKVKAYNQSQNPRKRLVAKLVRSPRELLVTLLMLNVAMNILAQNTVSSIFENFPGWILSVGLPLALTLIFGEVIPKSLAITNNAKVAYFVSPIVYFFNKILGPVRVLVSKITGSVSHFFFFFLRKEKDISLTEIKHALKTSTEFGLLQDDEAKLLRGYLNLEEITIKEIMRPRQDMIFYDIEKPLSELVRLFVDEECSRMPVCERDIDNIKGILEADEFLIYKGRINNSQELLSILDKPFYIPESITAKQLLTQFREKDEQFAIVVDEYGSVNGLITKEDLVELVFGQIEDKRDEAPLFVQSGPDVIIANGKMELVELEEIFEANFDSTSNMATIGGWLIEQMGDIPKNGSKFVTEDFLFYILSASPNKINRIYIRKLKTKQRFRKKI